MPQHRSSGSGRRRRGLIAFRPSAPNASPKRRGIFISCLNAWERLTNASCRHGKCYLTISVIRRGMDVSKYFGFTLIELLVAVAIVAILAALSLPVYQSYTIRTRVSECANLMGGLKSTVLENAANGNPLAYGFNTSNSTPNCGQLRLSDTGVISITSSAIAGSVELTLRPSPPLTPGVPPEGTIVWTCESPAPVQHLAPKECQNSPSAE